MTKKLYELKPGQSAVVEYLEDMGRIIADRLSDIGLTKGSQVVCTMKSPLGDPSAYLIKGSIIALRMNDAAVVTVRPLSESSADIYSTAKEAKEEVLG